MSTKSIVTHAGAEFRTAIRINQSLTASVEKRALRWLAERAPAWVSSDQLTASALARRSAPESVLRGRATTATP